VDSTVLEQRMPHAKTALILIVAFALPGAAEALGLGEIHVDSALNEPLAAEVDIVGATAEDLAGITASIANRETFVRFGVDRPAFLSTAAFKIAMDSKGQPVLAIRSTDAFTEPLINMLIDLRWHSGELIRQYTLLLDPARFSSNAGVAETVPTGSGPAAYTAPVAPEQVSETSQPASQATPIPEQTSPAFGGPVPPNTVKVGVGATLHGIASRVSSSGNAGLERTMIAIFRANPRAFEGNINRLRLGAVLTIPSFPEVSKISAADANQEIRLQMETWNASTKFVGPAKPVPPAAAAPAPVPYEAQIPTEPAAARQESTSRALDDAIHTPGNTDEASDDAALDRRVQILEKGLNELQGALGREQDTLAGIQARVALADETRAVTVVPPVAKSGHAIGTSVAAFLVLASGAFGILYAWRRRRTFDPTVSPSNAKTQYSGASQIAARAAASHEITPAAPARNELPADAQIVAQPHAKDEVRQSVSDSSADGQTISGATALDSTDVESLEASYFSEASSGGLQHTVNIDTAETANPASATMKTRAPDANAETMPLGAVRIAGVPEVSTPELSAPDNMTSADKLDGDTAKLQYQLLDLDGTAHHVPMPSILYEKGRFKERRTSLVDVLKVAVKREPNRRDLRMKLLETYYAAAATSRQGFLEVAQSLASERENMTDGEWGKIAGMGRQIAADKDLFATATAQADNKDLATCA
jgi:pilus assembly protein FimV